MSEAEENEYILFDNTEDEPTRDGSEEPRYSRGSLERMREFRPYKPVIRVIILPTERLKKAEARERIHTYLNTPI